MIRIRAAALLVLASPLAAAASDAFPARFEIGVQIGGIQEHVLGEYPVTAGGRATVHVFRFLEKRCSACARGGVSAESVFMVRRPGFMRFDTNAYVPELHTRAALDAGGIIEFYSRRHVAARIDFGDTAVWYGTGIVIPPISGIGGNVIPGTRHQFYWNLGVSVWF